MYYKLGWSWTWITYSIISIEIIIRTLYFMPMKVLLKWTISYGSYRMVHNGGGDKVILLSPFQLKLVVGSFYRHQWRNKNQMAFWWFQGRYQMHIRWNRAVLGPRVQQCEPLSVCEYHVEVLSKKTKNSKTMNDLRNFGKQLIQFLLSPQFAIVFIFIIACFYILILPNKHHSLDFI